MIVFTDRELEFLQKEFDLSAEDITALSEDEWMEIADQCFDIEL